MNRISDQTPGLFRHDHRPAAKAAAAEIAKSAPKLRAAVLEFIASRGAFGATDAEVQDALGMNGNTQRPRRRELEAAGHVRASGITRQTPSGRHATVFVAVRGGAA